MVEKMPYKVVRVDESWWGHLNYPVEKSEEIETKVALLRLCDNGEYIKNVGKRQSHSIFYVHYFGESHDRDRETDS